MAFHEITSGESLSFIEICSEPADGATHMVTLRFLPDEFRRNLTNAAYQHAGVALSA